MIEKKLNMSLNNKIFEWAGVITAILYSLFVAMNIGIEFFGFCLLLISAILIGIWAYRGGHRGILFLQFFYATAGIIGMFWGFLLKGEIILGIYFFKLKKTLFQYFQE